MDWISKFWLLRRKLGSIGSTDLLSVLRAPEQSSRPILRE